MSKFQILPSDKQLKLGIYILKVKLSVCTLWKCMWSGVIPPFILKLGPRSRWAVGFALWAFYSERKSPKFLL